MSFNSDEYFTKRQRLAQSTKMSELAAKRDAKQVSLDEGVARSNLMSLHARELAAETMTGRLGLDTDSVAGRAVNIAASTLSGIARASGDVGALAPTLATVANEAGMSESDFQAYNRYVAGKATPQDMALLNSPTEVSTVNGIKNATRMEMFKQATEARKSAIDIDKQFDLNAAVDQGARNALHQELGDAFQESWGHTKKGFQQIKEGEVINGMDNMLGGAITLAGNALKAGLTHTQASAEYIAENAPQLAIGGIRKVGAGLLLGSNAGYGADYYHKGIAKYQAEHDGQYPPEAMRKQMAQDAGLAAGMEQISDKVSLGLGKLATAAKIGQNAGRVSKTIGATVGGTLNESITEGIQTYLEGEASLTPASAEDIYVGAAIGGITGGAMTGGMRGINELGEAAKARVAKKVPVTETPEFKETFKTAVETNNPDLFLDKETANYNPVAAVGVLFQAAKAETATPEIKTTNFTKATEIVEALEQERETLINGDQQAIADKTVQIQAMQEKLDAVDPADTVKTEALQGMIDLFTQELKEAQPDPEASAPKIAQLENALAVARRVQGEIGTMVNPVAPEDFQNLVASVKSTEKGVASQAADTLINLSMTAPDSVDVKALSQLVADKANGLKPEQRAALRQFTEARRKENSLMNIGKVSATILTGDPAKRQMGIMQYRKEIGVALKAGNQKAAERPLKLLANFVASHTQKATLTAQALATGEVRQVVRLESGEWEIRDPALPPLSQKEMTDSGSVTVMPTIQKSVELVQNIAKEAEVLKNSHAQLSAAVNAKFSGQVANAQALSIYVLENGQDKPRPEINSGVEVSQPPLPSTKSTKTEPTKPTVQSTEVGNKSVSTPSSQPSGQSVADAPSATAVPAATTQVSKEAQAELDKVGLDINDLISDLSREEILSEIEYAQAEIQATTTNVATPDATKVSTGNTTQTTGKQAAAEQQDVAQAESPVAEAVVAYTGLKVFAQKVKDLSGKMQDIFLTTNLVAQFLKQKQTSDKYKSARPLVSMENFISQWNSKQQPIEVFLKDFMEAREELDELQVTALNHMRKFITDLLPEFKKDLVEYTGDPAFKSRDPMQYLLENGDVDENVKAAMAYSVYSYLLSQASNPTHLTYEQVNEMHNKDEGEILTDEAYGELSQYSTFENTFIDEVGSVAVQALGFIPEDNAPVNLLPNLVTAMGIRILAVMEREGYIKRVARNAREVEIMMNPNNEESAKTKFSAEAEFNYIKFVREADGKTLTDPVRMLKDVNGGTKGIVDHIFGSDKATRIAPTTPQKFTQQFAKGTEQDISEAQRKVIQETMDTPHTAIPAMMQLFSLMGRDAVLKAAGWTEVNEKTVHGTKKLSVEAQNQNLENQFDKMMEMYTGNPEDQKYFVEQFVGKNFRAYFANQSLNQQTSKIHRFAFQRPGWEVEIDLMNTDLVNEYKVSVAMMLGVKTDGQLNSKTLAQFDSWLNDQNPQIAQAIEVIRAGLVAGDDAIWTEVNKNLVAEAAQGAEGMATLQAMTSYAHYLNAIADGQTKFKTTLLVGVDGKTNGPMLSHLALGAAADIDGFYVLLNRGGFFREGEATHYSEHAANGAMDLYQDLGMQIVTTMYNRVKTSAELQVMAAIAKKTGKWKEFYSHFTADELNALQTITGNLVTSDGLGVTSAGRNLTKTPLTSFAFGSSIKKSIGNMENKFIESIYENIEKISVGNPKAPTRLELIQAINSLIRAGSGKEFLPETMTVERMMEKDVLAGKEKALRKGFQRIVNVPVSNTMNTYFAVFIDRRKSMVNTVQAAYSAYATAYEALRNTEINRLMNEGEIAYRMSEGEMKPLHELSVKQERDLRAKVKSLLPVMHTDYSIRENNLDAGLYMAKSDRKTMDAPLYSSKVELGTPLEGRKSTAVEAKAIVRTEASPGVAGASYPIHSGDSANMHKTLAKVKNSLNVHDEVSNGVTQVKEAARTINEMTADTFLNYSPAREAVFMLERILLNMVKGIKDGSIHKSAVRNMYDQWLETYNKGRFDEPLTAEEIAEYVVNDSVGNAYRADNLRLEAFSQMAYLDQYVWEGGQFQVTPEMRQLATDRLNNLKDSPSAEVLKMIDFLNKAYVEEELGITSIEGSTVDLTVDPEGDPDVVNISSALLALPGNLAMRAVEMIKEHFPAVHTAMVQGSNLMSAIHELTHAERSDILQTLAQMGKKAVTNISPWGELGASSGHNANLLALFDGKEFITLKELAPILFQELKTAGSMTDSYHMLLKQAMRVVDNDLKIVLVRPDTSADAILDKGASNARGWYVSKNDDQAIYVLSPDFANSKVAPELLLHELVHGALARVIQSELDNPTNTPVGQHVKNLQALLEEAKTFVKNSKIKGMEAALVNVHELVSWGLTNKRFQKEVLGKMTSGVETKITKLVNGMKHFITNLTGILFRGSKLNQDQRASNGLMVLAVNAAALYKEAAQSNKRSDIITNQEADPVGEVASMTTIQLYDALVNHNGEEVDVAHDQHLRGLLDGIVNKIHGPMGSFKAELMQNQDLSGREILAEAITSGQMPFGSEALNIGGMTEQEAFVLEQVEATVASALEDGGAQTGVVHRELLGLYEEMRNRLKPEHFHAENATSIEIQEAQEIYDFLFKVEAKDGKSDYLSRFAAIGLVHKEVREAMQISTKMRSDSTPDTDFLTRLMEWFEKALGMISAKLTHTYPGMNADQKLGSLVQQLVDLEAKRKRITLQRKMKANPADMMMGKASNAIRERVVAFGESKFFKTSTNVFVKAAGSMTAVIAGDRLALFGKTLNDIRNAEFEGRQGLFAGILNEMRGATESNVVFHFLLRAAKRIEGQRKDIMTGTTKLILESFANKGANLQQSDKKAISAGVLRTDMGALLKHFGMQELNVLVQNDKALDREIKKFEDKLTTKYRHFYIKQSRLLGYHMATGDARAEMVLLNAGNIARMYETPYVGRPTAQEVAESEPIIDALASLQAMKHTRTAHKVRLRKVFQDEMARTDGGNGLELTMLMHQKLLQESKERLFSEGEALYMKGYTPEIYNPYKSVQAATSEEGKSLEAQGWKKGDPVVTDTEAVDQEQRWLYTLNDGGQSRRVSGTISNTGMKARGDKMHDGNIDSSSSVGKFHLNQMNQVSAAKRKAVALMFKADPNFNPAEANKGKQFMIPVLNADGRIANWRYMMKQSTKDRVLDRDNRFEQILGTMAGSIFDKQVTKTQNREVIKALKQQYDSEYGRKPGSYVAIGPMSTDPEFREIYNLLPQDTKVAIRGMFGKDEMMVRVDLLDINFGYRKLSWADGFGKDKAERDLLEEMMVTATTYVFGQKAPLRVRQGQLWWQTVVQMTKDNMVVKSFSTLSGNFKSNISELLWFGVPMKDIVKHHRVAFKGALDYRRDSEELFNLEQQLELDYMVGPQRKEMEARAVRLRDAVNRNPIKPLIDAGLMPTIVEDVDMQEDIYSYKSKFVRSTEKVTKHLNKQVVTAGKWALMTQDTPLYKWMSHGTQLSDFVARYTLYQHLTTRSVEKMDHTNAVQMTSEAFVNYDIPSHRRLQALNDDGFVWFTKYYLRIQKVILMLMRENPGRTMGMVGLETYFATLPTLLDSAAASKLGNNPFSTGALKFMGTHDDTMVIKALMSPFK